MERILTCERDGHQRSLDLPESVQQSTEVSSSSLFTFSFPAFPSRPLPHIPGDPRGLRRRAPIGGPLERDYPKWFFSLLQQPFQAPHSAKLIREAFKRKRKDEDDQESTRGKCWKGGSHRERTNDIEQLPSFPNATLPPKSSNESSRSAQ